MNIKCIILLLTLNFCYFQTVYCLGDDLSDGIQIDDNIEEYDDIIGSEINKEFIILKAVCNESEDNNLSNISDDSRYISQGGIILTPGSIAEGDITLIYEGDDNTLVTGD